MQESIQAAQRDFPQFQGVSPAELQDWLRRILIDSIVSASQGYRQTDTRNLQREASMAGSAFPQAADETIKNRFDVEVRDATPKRLGRFELIKKLGAGSFGVVYLAQDPTLGRLVALKIPRPEVLFSDELRQRFLYESRMAAKLDHASVVPVYEAGETEGCLYLVSAYCPGASLRDWMIEHGVRQSPRFAIALIERLACALTYCHEQGILHRDLKPANVMLVDQRDGELPFIAKLTDFGLAKALDGDQEAANSLCLSGTPLYMAPEQARVDVARIGPPTDVYALGVMLYELLTGRTPFQGATLVDVLDQVRNVKPLPPSHFCKGISRTLDRICLRCLEKQPEDRYQSAAELAIALQRELPHSPDQPGPLLDVSKEGSLERRHHVRRGINAALLLMFVCLASAAAGWYVFQRSTDDAPAKVSLDNVGMRFQPNGDVLVADYRYAGNEPLTAEGWMLVDGKGGIVFTVCGVFSLDIKQHEDGHHVTVTGTVSQSELVLAYMDEKFITGVWHHVAVMYDTEQLQLFIDGKRAVIDEFLSDGIQPPVLIEKPVPLTAAWGILPLTIGSNDLNSSVQRRYPLTGNIRSFRISRGMRYVNDFEPPAKLDRDDQTEVLYELTTQPHEFVPDLSGHGHTARVTPNVVVSQ